MRLKLMTASEYRACLDLPGRLFYVYVLTNKAGIPFYVGKGVRPRGRMYYRALAHERDARSKGKSAVAQHIRRLWLKGDAVRYHHHFDSNVEAYALFEEQVLIGSLSDRYTLANRTGGGQGMYGHKASAETRRKMSESRTGRKQSLAHSKAISAGRRVSAKVKRACRAARKPMTIDGIDYESCAQAANALGVCKATIYYRFNNNWSGYSYKEL